MRGISELKPYEVFKNFQILSSIPHGSGNTKKISDYCVEQAKRHNYKYVQDQANNVIIYVNGTQGYKKGLLQMNKICDSPQFLIDKVLVSVIFFKMLKICSITYALILRVDKISILFFHIVYFFLTLCDLFLKQGLVKTVGFCSVT